MDGSQRLMKNIMVEMNIIFMNVVLTSKKSSYFYDSYELSELSEYIRAVIKLYHYFLCLI
jgi:hypothetical protein